MAPSLAKLAAVNLAIVSQELPKLTATLTTCPHHILPPASRREANANLVLCRTATTHGSPEQPPNHRNRQNHQQYYAKWPPVIELYRTRPNQSQEMGDAKTEEKCAGEGANRRCQVPHWYLHRDDGGTPYRCKSYDHKCSAEAEMHGMARIGGPAAYNTFSPARRTTR
jgi:hypothetical protein